MSTNRKRILCVDDDEDTCTMLTVFLGQSEFEVVTAQTASEGLKLARQESFDLFLLDLWFKEDDKIELFRRIREFDQQTPLIIYSADARLATQENLRAANVQAFLIKPKGLDHLIQTIKQLTDCVGSAVKMSDK